MPREENIRPPVYACLPSAAALLLAYYGTPETYANICREIPVSPSGDGNLADLVSLCERKALCTVTYRNLSLTHIKRYLKQGFCVIVVYGSDSSRHASVLFGAGDNILAADMLLPLHHVNMDRLGKEIESGMITVIVGKQPISPPGFGPINTIAIVAATGLAAIALIFLSRKKKGLSLC